MSLRVFIAGCLPKDRGQIEGVVKKALGERSETGPWNVSLVKVAGSWSINLEGPEPKFKGLNLTSEEDRLHETIRNALGGQEQIAPAAQTRAGESRPLLGVETAKKIETTGDSRDRYDCPKCRRPFVVIYAPQSREPETKAPVACPHCWQVTQVTVTESAAATQDYRAEAIVS